MITKHLAGTTIGALILMAANVSAYSAEVKVLRTPDAKSVIRAKGMEPMAP